MKKIFIVLAVIFLILRLPYLNSPLTFEEVNNFNNFSIYQERLLSIFLGLVSLLVFAKFLSKLQKDIFFDKAISSSRLFIICLVLFTISPWVIQITLFSLKSTIVVLLLLVSFVIFEKKSKLLFISTLIIFLIINLNSLNSLIDQSIVNDIKPQNFLWQVDERLAFAQVENYSFRIGSFDLSRLVHNKITYSFNNFFIAAVSPFNLEELSSPLQAHSPAAIEINNRMKLPQVFFFEWPLIFLGVINLFKKKSKINYLFFCSIFWIIIFHNLAQSLVLILPFLIIFESYGVMFLINKFSKTAILMLVILFVFGQASLFDLLKFHPALWMGNEDFAQWQIWMNLKNNLNKYPKLTVTDRLGKPEKYFQYYVGNSNINLSFKSFKYLESDRREGQIWVGLPGEFGGASGDFNENKEIDDGLILQKIKDIKQPDPTLGDELWVVETKLNK